MTVPDSSAQPDRSDDPQINPHAPPQTYQEGQPHPPPEHTLGHGASGHGPETHHIGLPTYLVIFAVLMVLLVVTVVAAFFDFGHPLINIIIAMGIAAVKTTVVVLYFMHVKYSSRLTQVFVVAGVFWLAILFTLLFGDYETRGVLPMSAGWTENLPASSELGGNDRRQVEQDSPADAPPQRQGGTGERR